MKRGDGDGQRAFGFCGDCGGKRGAECEQCREVTIFDGAREQIGIANFRDGGEAKLLCIDGEAGELIAGDRGCSDCVCGGAVESDEMDFPRLAFVEHG